MLTLLAQQAPSVGFWRSPSVYTVADIVVTVLLVVGVVTLWFRFAHWRKATAPLFKQVGHVMADLAGVKGELAGVKKDMVGVRHDINAVGETVSSLGESLGTDIVESEERLVAKLNDKLDTIANAQVVMMQTLSVRPCIVREAETQSRPCPDDEVKA